MTRGAFSEWQPRYAAHGVVTFPVTADKVPAVKGYLRLGMKTSAQLSLRFADNDAFGFACRRNRITVLDVDTPDERVLADALSRHGTTPFIVRSGSGNFQGWYRHNGETRKVRPDPSKPIDILGDGFVVAPPSRARRGEYQIVAGMLDDLDRLPVMRDASGGQPSQPREILATPTDAIAPPVAEPTRTEDQKRNDRLWRHCMKAARPCGSLEKLMEAAITYNNTQFYEPLPADEVLKIVASAWGYEVEGKNQFGYGPRVVLNASVVADLAKADTQAFALLAILQLHHAGAESFILANAMAESLGWDLRSFKAARATLTEGGFIVCLHAGGRGPRDPPVYRLATG